jgi:hypothetical protein
LPNLLLFTYIVASVAALAAGVLVHGWLSSSRAFADSTQANGGMLSHPVFDGRIAVPLLACVAVFSAVATGLPYALQGTFTSFGNGGGPPDPTPPANLGIGVSNPIELLSYRYRDTAPAFCKDPDRVLDAIASAFVDGGRTAGAMGCTTRRLASDIGGATELELTCRVTESDGCRDYYRARVWVDRVPRSTTDYVVRGVGWGQRVCDGASQPFDASEVRERSQGVSAEIQAVVNACKEP